MRSVIFLFISLAMTVHFGCKSSSSGSSENLFNKENLLAWCIVPFDAAERNPGQRANMLQELGISMLAYDYRERHVASFEEEIHTLEDHQISLSAVWMWIEPEGEELINSMNKTILNTLEKTGTSTELWISFPDHFYAGLSEEKKLDKAVRSIKDILKEAESLGCTLALYNHGDWFGEPENQIKIIQAIGSEKISLVYNFHHGHHQMARFEELFGLMLPYLSAVNLNGMSDNGPKIIPLGEGERELEMLRVIKNSGYAGPIGILGHTEGLDIRPVLEQNLKGLQRLSESL